MKYMAGLILLMLSTLSFAGSCAFQDANGRMQHGTVCTRGGDAYCDDSPDTKLLLLCESVMNGGTVSCDRMNADSCR